MEDAFRSFILGLGIMLGLVEGGADPSLACRVHRDAERIYVSAEVADAVSPSLSRLLESGNAIGVELAAYPSWWNHGISFRQTLRKLNGVYLVTLAPDGAALSVPSADAALLLLFRFHAIPVCATSVVPRDGFRIEIDASILVNDAPAADSAVLWNYQRPHRRFTWSSLTEVPY